MRFNVVSPRPIWLAVSFVLAIAAFEHLHVEAEEKDRLLGRVVSAEDFFELNDAYLTIRRVSSAKLRTLKCHSHDGIALQAAWEDVRRQVPIPHVPDMERWVKVERLHAERFVGFVEGRLAVPVPEWWEHLLVARNFAMAEHGGYVLLRIRPKKNQAFYEETNLDPDDMDTIWMPFNVYLKDKSEEQLVLSVNRQEVAVPRVVDHPWGINAKPIDDRRWLVAMHGEAYAPCDLICLNAPDNVQLWRSEIWGEVPFGFRRGTGYFHWLDFRVRDNTAYVFGVTAQVFYVEGFSLTDGTCRFRFSTSYGVDLEAE